MHQRLGAHIQGTSRLIEDENRGLFQQGASKRDPLTLAAGKGSAPTPYDGLVAVCHRHNLVMNVCPLRCFDNFIVCGFAVEGNVVSNSGIDNIRVLRHECNTWEPVFISDILRTDTIDEIITSHR